MDVLNEFFKKNKTYNCKIIKIKPTYVVLETSGILGICHISEVSDYKIRDLNHFFEVGKFYYFQLIDFSEAKKLYSFSYKKINAKLLKNHHKIIPSISGFKNLYENTMRKLYEK